MIPVAPKKKLQVNFIEEFHITVAVRIYGKGFLFICKISLATSTIKLGYKITDTSRNGWMNRF